MNIAERDAPDAVAASMAYCREVARRQAKNFYYGLKLLPEPKRSAMFTLYAYMRRADDLADETDHEPLSVRQAKLETFGCITHAVLEATGAASDDWPGWPAFGAMVKMFHIPGHLFDSMVQGQIRDLLPVCIETFDELLAYCYQVAGVVGLASLYIWGFTGGEGTLRLAVERGAAFQLTNILRDLREDARLGRTYLPAEELKRFGVAAADFGAGRDGAAFQALMKFQIGRASDYYYRSAALDAAVSADSRPTLFAMTEIYHGLLRKIAQDPSRPLYSRVRLSGLQKSLIAARACLQKSG